MTFFKPAMICLSLMTVTLSALDHGQSCSNNPFKESCDGDMSCTTLGSGAKICLWGKDEVGYGGYCYTAFECLHGGGCLTADGQRPVYSQTDKRPGTCK